MQATGRFDFGWEKDVRGSAMTGKEKILYQNEQWKLLFWKNTYFIEAKHPYPYWRHAKELQFDRHMIEHIADKNWCDVERLIDVACKAVKMLGITPEYDMGASMQRARVLGLRRINSKPSANKGRWISPSEIEDVFQ